MSNAEIKLTNVRVNNLKNISLSIPHRQWVSICGLSGSGKSSLAFETLYAEGQRRYMEALSVKTRQFLQQLDRPDADQISGLPPAIAIRAAKGKPGRRTSLASATEIEALLRLLFAKTADSFCPKCNQQVGRDSPQSVADWFEQQADSKRAVIAWPIPKDSDLSEVAKTATKDGFVRAIAKGSFLDLQTLAGTADGLGDAASIVVDRVRSGDVDAARLTESLETAFHCGEGKALVLVESESGESETHTIDGQQWRTNYFSTETHCARCDLLLPLLEPRLFSVTNSHSACATCDGTGLVKDTQEKCYACLGRRLNETALAFRVADRNFGDVCAMTIVDFQTFLQSLQLSPSQTQTAAPILKRIATKLQFLIETGLGHLSLDRPLRTLSSGEAQRVLLTTVLGTTLTNMLIVLDEPSIGLHAHNVTQINSCIEQLHRRGNTVVVVDHDPAVIERAERLIEIGPGAGADGGEVVFDGSAAEILDDEESLTGQYLSRRRGFSAGQENRRKSHRFLKLIGASGHNLKTINVEFPLGVLCAVTGVSGAGKSSLVMQTLYGAVSQKLGHDVAGTLPFEEVHGADWVSEVVLVDDSPIGKSSRSNPVTYVKAFSEIRNCFAETADAKRRNFGPGKFSFNVAGGRCEKCRGDGQLSLNMQFMPDIWVTCDQCNGSRFREDVLEVRYRDQNIAQVLSMTVRQAFPFFRGHPAVQGKLKALIDVGLEYVPLGQTANTLSSGESQRLKLAHYLNTAKNRRVLFLLDQPTTGLHPHDNIRLLDCFGSLISVGHSMIVVEHNLDFIKHADWIIDLGPGAAGDGGKVVTSGTPEDVAACKESLTGQHLASRLS